MNNEADSCVEVVRRLRDAIFAYQVRHPARAVPLYLYLGRTEIHLLKDEPTYRHQFREGRIVTTLTGIEVIPVDRMSHLGVGG